MFKPAIVIPRTLLKLIQRLFSVFTTFKVPVDRLFKSAGPSRFARALAHFAFRSCARLFFGTFSAERTQIVTIPPRPIVANCVCVASWLDLDLTRFMTVE